MFLRIIYIFPIALLLLSIPAAAGPDIEDFFEGFEDHRFVMLDEETQLEENQKIGPFSREILEESSFRSYSRWRVERDLKQAYNLEVYDLLDPLGAFSLLTLWPRLHPDNDWTPLPIPVGNFYRPEEGVFWRGNFLLRVSARSGQTLSTDQFSSIASSFYAGIELENLYPVSISHLPKDGLISSSVEFYLGSDSLNLNPRFPEPLLEEIGFVDKIEIAFGSYEPDESALFLIGYATPALADEYFVRLQKGLQAFFSSEGVYMKRAGVIIALFTGPETSAQQILSQVEYSPSVKWLYEKEDDTYTGEVLSFLGMLTQTILGTGVFLLMIVGTGFAAGLIRYAILLRFPALTRRKEMICLKLDDRKGSDPSSF